MQSPISQRALLIATLALLAGLLGWLLSLEPPPPGVGNTPPKGGDFTLQSARGPVALADYRGKVVALFFGYTWCPDICPTSLSIFAAALNRLTPEEQGRVQGIFISVDPPRDTLERLVTYAAYFHPGLIGVTGTPEEIAKVAAAYGAAYRRVEQEGATGYTIDHTAETYLIAPDGKLTKSLQHGTPPDQVVEAMRALMRGTP